MRLTVNDPSVFLVDVGDDPVDRALHAFDDAIAHVERKHRGRSAVVWHRTLEDGKRAYRVAAVWQDDQWQFFGRACVPTHDVGGEAGGA